MSSNLINSIAEGVVLGAILAQPEAIVELDTIVRPADFAVPLHQWVAAAAWECLGERTPPTLAAVIGKLQAAGRWSERVSKSTASMEDLDALVGSVSDADVAYVKHNAGLVAALALRRNGQREMIRLAKMFEEGELAPEELQGEINRQVGAVFAGRAGRDGSLDSIGREEDDRLARGVQQGVTCGIKWLDAAVGGFQPGEVWVLGGAYKSSKTRSVTNMVLAAALAGAPVSMFTVGDSTRDSTYRQMLAMAMNMEMLRQGGLPGVSVASAQALRYPLQNQALQKIKADAEQWLRPLPIRLYDGRDRVGYLAEAERLIRRDVAMQGTRVVVYDFAQACWEGTTDYEKSMRVAPWCQQIAGELGITVVVLSQLSEETVRGNNNSHSPGAKGGGALPAAANVFLVTSYQEPTLKITLKLARNAGAIPGGIDHLVSPPSGLILDWDK